MKKISICQIFANTDMATVVKIFKGCMVFAMQI